MPGANKIDPLAESLWRKFGDARGTKIWEPVANEVREWTKKQYCAWVQCKTIDQKDNGFIHWINSKYFTGE